MSKAFFAVLLPFTLSARAMATGWASTVYEMPRTVIDTSKIAEIFSGSRISIGSIVSVGLVILGIAVSLKIIPRIVGAIVFWQTPSAEGVSSRGSDSPLGAGSFSGRLRGSRSQSPELVVNAGGDSELSGGKRPKHRVSVRRA